MNAHFPSAVDTLQHTLQSALSQAGQNGKAAADGLDFSAILAQITVTETNTEPQTVEDVKREFSAYLDSLPVSPGLSRTAISVNVTEAAFEKMLADPDYKQKMKDLCKRDLCDPAWNRMGGIAPSDMVLKIDADVENEYIGSSYGSAYRGVADRAAGDGDGFWSRRTKRSRAARQEEKKHADERQDFLAFLQEQAYRKKTGLDAASSGFMPAGVSAAASFFAEIASGGGASGL